MNIELRKDAEQIIKESVESVLPDEAVVRALEEFKPGRGKLVLVAAGKAAWQMASVAVNMLGTVDCGIVITKYGHVKGNIPGVECVEAGHPVPDENSFRATGRAMEIVKNLEADDTVLFLLSGGGSALFEAPLISGEDLQDITKQMLSSGADIVEINTVRKRLSKVKGGRFAKLCAPARVYSIVLSDILGDSLDMIASGPAYPDASTCEQAKEIVEKYGLKISEQVRKCLMIETPKSLDNICTRITGSVTELCRAAKKCCEKLGYETTFLTDQMACEARDAGSFLGSIAKSHAYDGKKRAFIAGGETVVTLKGSGKGGRNQEIALSAALQIDGIRNAAVFSIGSDGTDGPTDAAGGYADGDTADAIRGCGLDPIRLLGDNDSYTALKSANGLIITGPTGTNVNDVAVILVNKNLHIDLWKR